MNKHTQGSVTVQSMGAHLVIEKVSAVPTTNRKRIAALYSCGAKAQAHHNDYSKPLDVRWLCRKHHDEHHAKAEGR